MAADASRSVDTGAQIAPRDVCTVRNQYGEAVPLCLIDACGVCEAPVWLDAWPSATPYSWPVRHSTCARDARDAPDPYWDAELWEHVASVATERRMAHGTRWWTSADVHVAPATAFHGSEWAEDAWGKHVPRRHDTSWTRCKLKQKDAQVSQTCVARKPSIESCTMQARRHTRFVTASAPM